LSSRCGAGARRDDVALAIDIGGSNVRAGLVRRDGELLGVTRIATSNLAAPGVVLDLVRQMASDLVRSVHERSGPMGTGVSIAGFVTQSGLVTATAHLSPAWVGLDLRRELADLPQPQRYGLDSPTPALGEAYFGAGKGKSDLVYVTVSTGIGAAIVVRGRHWGGAMGWAGGIGHTIIDEASDRQCPGCGNQGCLETFAARQGIETTAREIMAIAPPGELFRLCGGDSRNMTVQLVAEAAAVGDPAAVEALRRAGHALGVGLTNLIDVLAPALVVVGGGIASAGDLLLEPARAVVRDRAFPPILRDVPIVPAALGDLSGLFGAAVMVLRDVRVADPTIVFP
jgi:glucokinase